jgi:hypothetical protein
LLSLYWIAKLKNFRSVSMEKVVVR